MFSVGDLVDRGPDSLACLQLIREPWFHCVLSNHEQMMFEAFNGGYMGQFWLMNGGVWGMETLNVANYLQAQKLRGEMERSFDGQQNAAQLRGAPIITDLDMELIDLLQEVEQLPFIITINHKSGKKFHVIHAELPPGEKITDSDLSSPGRVMELATKQTRDGDCFLWGRYTFAPFCRVDLSDVEKQVRKAAYDKMHHRFNDELSHIISGHSIVQRPLTIVGQTNIDTGAYGSYDSDARSWEGLTCIDLDTWTFYRATEATFQTVEPLVINRADIEAKS